MGKNIFLRKNLARCQGITQQEVGKSHKLRKALGGLSHNNSWRDIHIRKKNQQLKESIEDSHWRRRSTKRRSRRAALEGSNWRSKSEPRCAGRRTATSSSSADEWQQFSTKSSDLRFARFEGSPLHHCSDLIPAMSAHLVVMFTSIMSC